MKAGRSLLCSGWDVTEVAVTNPLTTGPSHQHQSGLFAGKQAPLASASAHLKTEDRPPCVLNCLFKAVWTAAALKINHFPPQKKPAYRPSQKTQVP